MSQSTGSASSDDSGNYILNPAYYVCTDEHCPAPCRHHDDGHTDNGPQGRYAVLYLPEAMLDATAQGCQHCWFLLAAREHILTHSRLSPAGSNLARLRRQLGVGDASSIAVPGLELNMVVEVFKDGRASYFLRLDVSKDASKVGSFEWSAGIVGVEDTSPPAFRIPRSPMPHDFMDVLSDYSMSIAESWLARCVSQHERCREVADGSRPHRLLRVTDNAVQLTDEEVLDDYVALSYTWSGAMLPLTLESNLQHRLTHPLPWSDLPLTLQNAIIVTRRLKLDYIWIDCLCIVQDSKADWEREVVIMGAIYQQAHLVLSTDAADTPAAGFLERSRYLQPLEINVDDSTYILRDASSHAESGKVASRAWCYQERILARRTLKFADRELMWECSAGCSCECGQDKDTKHDAILQFSRPGYQIANLELAPGGPATHRAADDKQGRRTITAYEYWLFAIERYSLRSITYTADRLPAIRALAAFVQKRNGDEYIAGMWRKDLLRSLLWHVFGGSWTEQPREIGYVAPSWSWAAALRPVRFFAHTTLEAPFVAKVVDVHYELTTSDALGAVSTGWLMLEGPCLDVLVYKHGEDFEFSFEVRGVTTRIDAPSWHRGPADRQLWRASVFDSQPVCSVELETSTDRRVVLQRSETMAAACGGWVKIMWITSNRALILAVSQQHKACYERLGLARLALHDRYFAREERLTVY